MADRYWVNGSGTWNSSDTSHWSDAAGGSSGASAPTSSDDVYFGSSSHSGTCTVTVATGATCRSLYFTEGTGYTKTFAGSGTLSVYGSMILYSSMTWSKTANLYFEATSGSWTIDAAGKTTNTTTLFRGNGGTWTLAGNYNSSSSTFGHSGGTLDTAGYTVTCASFNSTGTTTRTLTITNSTINCTQTNLASTTGLTFNSSGSIIKVTSTGAISIGDSITVNEIQANGSSHLVTITGTPTITTFKRTGTNSFGNYLNLASNLTATNLTLAGNSSIYRLIVQNGYGSGMGQYTLSCTNLTASNLNLQDVVGAGSASWDISAIPGGSGDLGGNSNITFTTPATIYWKHGASASTTISVIANLYTETDGGGSANQIPLAQHTIRFDANSFPATGKTVDINMPHVGGLDFTDCTNSPTLGTNSFYTHGHLRLPGVTVTSTSNSIYLSGRGSFDFLPPTTFNRSLWCNAPTGTYTLTGDISASVAGRFFTHYGGTFDLNGYNMTMSSFAMNSSIAKTFYARTGTITLYLATGTVFNLTASMTFYCNTSTIKFTGALTADVTFSGNGNTFYNFWNATTNAYNLIITGSNTFADFKIDAGRTVKFTSGITTTVTTFTAVGTALLGIVLTVTSAGICTMTKSGGDTITVDYCTINKSAATPGSTWYATNSTDGGNNTGWIFSAGGSNIKKALGVAYASIKKISGVAIASVKKYMGVT